MKHAQIVFKVKWVVFEYNVHYVHNDTIKNAMITNFVL